MDVQDFDLEGYLDSLSQELEQRGADVSNIDADTDMVGEEYVDYVRIEFRYGASDKMFSCRIMFMDGDWDYDDDPNIPVRYELASGSSRAGGNGGDLSQDPAADAESIIGAAERM